MMYIIELIALEQHQQQLDATYKESTRKNTNNECRALLQMSVMWRVAGKNCVGILLTMAKTKQLFSSLSKRTHKQNVYYSFLHAIF